MENNKNIKQQSSHIVHIDNRRSLDITGVTKVLTFNEEVIILSTVMGGLTIKGKGMKVNKLNVDSGDMSIEGEIISLVYNVKESPNRESLLKKLFK
ncbi:sporulation protein YabP [Fonticella tunisiensis]|uniref:Sporulation protein YabP n=1 Tax=Fonticella tunisiensis TaxID=1096341 RepID=A0A4R7KTW3_9CLOT|nr:sporulation protein YabP [Fonticella tunisiensis]TDT63469.1 sporulation protein YabP [Fonticella tunisiensis]